MANEKELKLRIIEPTAVRLEPFDLVAHLNSLPNKEKAQILADAMQDLTVLDEKYTEDTQAPMTPEDDERTRNDYKRARDIRLLIVSTLGGGN